MHNRDGVRIGLFARMLALAIVTAVLPGCVVFFREEPVVGPDPDAKDFVEVKAAEGTGVVLKDGKTLQIWGLDARGLSAFQQKRLQECIERLVLTHGHGGAGVPGCGEGPSGGVGALPTMAAYV